MTCIVGVETETEAILMGDSSAVSGGRDIRSTKLQKVFRVGDYVIGYTSSFRMGQILQYHIDYPVCSGEMTLDFMCREFVPVVRAAFKDLGYTIIELSQETGGQFLVAYHGKIFDVAPDFQVNRYWDGLYAIGYGAQYALGAMMAPEDPVIRAIKGLRAAERFSSVVCGPFVGPIVSKRE